MPPAQATVALAASPRTDEAALPPESWTHGRIGVRARQGTGRDAAWRPEAQRAAAQAGEEGAEYGSLIVHLQETPCPFSPQCQRGA